MRRLLPLAPVLLALGAAPAAAGCFAADGMPERARYDGGRVLDYVARDGDVLTYRSAGLESRLQAGIWPLGHQGDGVSIEYRWQGDLPDLAEVIAAGGTARAEGTLVEAGKPDVAVAGEVEILNQTTVDWEDCRYKAVEFRKRIFIGGTLVSEGVVLYAPEAMIAFRTDAVEIGGDKIYSYRLLALE